MSVLTAIDTNILLYALNADAPEHARARDFLESLGRDHDTVISELVLVELYVLLRNPALVPKPLTAPLAVAIVERFRRHPSWRLVDHEPAVMTEVWQAASHTGFGRGQIFDARLAYGLLRHGVTRLATRNTKDFTRYGFTEVFDPLD